jgi:hypothetical protein
MVIRFSARSKSVETVRRDHVHSFAQGFGDHSHGGYGEIPAFGNNSHTHGLRSDVPSNAIAPPLRWDYDLEVELVY